MKNTLIAILAGLVGALVLDKYNHECPAWSGITTSYDYGTDTTTITDLGPDPWQS
jgi:hypothetical protein